MIKDYATKQRATSLKQYKLIFKALFDELFFTFLGITIIILILAWIIYNNYNLF